jgi:hypothetical protein
MNAPGRRPVTRRFPTPTVVTIEDSAGRHVQVRLIGEPGAVAAVLAAISRALPTTPGGLMVSRRTAGHVLQHATVTAPGDPVAEDLGRAP